MDPLIIVYLKELIYGCVLGFVIGLTGIGGGVLVLPTMSVLLGMPLTMAVGTASFYSMLAKTYASYTHIRNKTIDLSLSLLFLVGAVPGNILTSVVINVLHSRFSDDPEVMARFQNNLKYFVIAIMVLSVLLLIKQLFDPPRIQKEGPLDLGKKVLGVVAGASVGAVMGATSIGGGVLVVPILILLFGMTANRTVGTSVFIGMVLTLITSVIYGMGAQLAYRTGVVMWLGSFPGVYLGSLLCARMPEKKLKAIVVGVVLLALGMMLFYRGGGH